MDPLTLKVSITGALRRPMGQLAPDTLADLLALAESDAVPKGLQGDLARFMDRIARDISDVPDGLSWTELLAEFAAVPAERIPESLRDMLEQESRREGRAAASAAAFDQAATAWQGVEPTAFQLGSRGARVVKGAVAQGNAGSPEQTEARSKRSTHSAGSSTRARAPKPPAFPEREAYLMQLIQERLARYMENGLAEQVLLVGIRKQANEHDPDVQTNDVISALRSMERKGRLRRSAGRYILERKW